MNTDIESTLRLTPQREKAARYIAEGAKQVEVATNLHLSKQTVNRWCNRDPEFMERVRELRLGENQEVLDSFVENVPEAKQAVIDITKNGGSATRLKAATYLLDYVKKNSNGNNGHASIENENEESDEEREEPDEVEADDILSRFE